MALDYNKLILKDARIFDPAKGRDCKGDIFIRDNHIVSDEFAPDENTRVINLRGYVAMPGLIDFHTHLNFGGSDVGLSPDLMLLPNGVTTAVDAGSCGVSNYESFARYTVPTSLLTIKSLLYISNTGQTTEAFAENLDPCFFDQQRILSLIKQYPDEILGLKIRMGKRFANGLEPLKRTIEIAEKAGCFLAVHMIDLPCSYEELLPLLRPGDILVHPFQFRGDTILDSRGQVRDCVREAQQRGVQLDLACARYNHSLEIARTAIEQGLYPDFITSDLGRNSIYERPVFSLPYVMSAFIAAGMSMEEVVKRCTTIPAIKMGIENSRGTLAPGAFADIAVFQLLEEPRTFYDKIGNAVKGDVLLSPKLTIKDGRILYQSIEIY